MAEVRRNLFRTIGDDPDFKLLPPEAQSGVRRDWVEQQMTASGRPYDQKLYEQLIREASYDLPQAEEKQSKFWFGGEAFPAAEEYAPRMLKFVDRLGRVFSAPQQFLQSAFRRPPDQPLAERVITPFAETAEGLIKDVLGEERELRYPYTMYTDPLLLGGVGKFGTRFLKKGIRSAEALAKRVRAPGAKPPSPMTGEAAEAFNRAKLAEEAARKSALRETVKEAIPPQRTGGPPRKLTRGEITYARDLESRLTGIFSKPEATRVANFISQHPHDPLALKLSTAQWPANPKQYDLYIKAVKAELVQRGVLSPAKTYRGIKQMPTIEESERRLRGLRGQPPSVRAPEVSTPEALNELEGVIKEYRKMGD